MQGYSKRTLPICKMTRMLFGSFSETRSNPVAHTYLIWCSKNSTADLAEMLVAQWFCVININTFVMGLGIRASFLAGIVA